MAGVSQSKAASHIFMSTVAFKNLMDKGVITKPTTGHGYDLDTVREQYVLYIRQIAAGRGGRTVDGLDPLAEKARKDKEMADRVALQNAVTRGELAPVRHFKSVLEDAFIRFRSRLIAMPSKLAPRLEGADRSEIKEAIRIEIEEALEEIRTTKYEPPEAAMVKEYEIPDDLDD